MFLCFVFNFLSSDSFAGYKNAMSMAQVKHDEKMKEKRYKQLAEGPIQQTYDYNPRVAQNEQLFKDSKLSNAKKGKK